MCGIWCGQWHDGCGNDIIVLPHSVDLDRDSLADSIDPISVIPFYSCHYHRIFISDCEQFNMSSKLATKSCDVVVLGAGIVGSATAYSLAKQNVDTVLLEQVWYDNRLVYPTTDRYAMIDREDKNIMSV